MYGKAAVWLLNVGFGSFLHLLMACCEDNRNYSRVLAGTFMHRVIRGVVIAVVLLAVVLAGIVAGLLVFGTAKAPKPMVSIIKPFAAMNYNGLPPVERYTARDGASLSFRTYTAGDKEVVVLIHGSAGSSTDMHLMAKSHTSGRYHGLCAGFARAW